jgi:transketolase
VCAYAPFISARSMEQVRNDVAYANQRVVIGAAASGISLGVAGGTHHSLEDLALMRSLPNMTVIVPADVNEAYKATLATLDIDGPVYLRLGGRTEEPPVGDPEAAFRLGKAVQLRAGNDVAVIACGALVEMAVRAFGPAEEGWHRRSRVEHAHHQAARSRCHPRCGGADPRHRHRRRTSPRRRSGRRGR